MLGGDGGFATARWREPASSDRLPSHRSESPTGYSSAGCSPAEPASASPVTDNSSSILIQRGNQIRCSTFTAAMQFRPRSSCPPPTGGVISTLRAGCHFYLAPTTLMSVFPNSDRLHLLLQFLVHWQWYGEPGLLLLKKALDEPAIVARRSRQAVELSRID